MSTKWYATNKYKSNLRIVDLPAVPYLRPGASVYLLDYYPDARLAASYVLKNYTSRGMITLSEKPLANNSDRIPEGTTNVYFSNERVYNALTAGSNITLTYTGGKTTISSSAISSVLTDGTTITTDALGKLTVLNSPLWGGYGFSTYLDQAVKTTSSPVFSGLTLSGLTVNGNISVTGTVDGFDLSTISITDLQDNQILIYDEASETWKNENFTGQGVSVHNDLTGIQGGTTGEYYHLTSAQVSSLLNLHSPVTLASPNHGLSLSTQTLALGTPSSITSSSTNTVTTTSHTHAITNGNLTASLPLSFNNARQVIGGDTALSLSINTSNLKVNVSNQLDTYVDFSTLVPYTGASYNVDLGSKDLTTTGILTAANIGIKETGSSPTYYSYFQGGDQSEDITYTLPDTLTDGYLKNTNGILSWSSVSSTGTLSAVAPLYYDDDAGVIDLSYGDTLFTNEYGQLDVNCNDLELHFVPYTGATYDINIGTKSLTDGTTELSVAKISNSCIIFYFKAPTVPAANEKIVMRAPFDFTWVDILMHSDGSDAVATLDIWTDSDANWPPTIADTIFDGAPFLSVVYPTRYISRTAKAGKTTVNAGDWIICNVNAWTSGNIALSCNIKKI